MFQNLFGDFLHPSFELAFHGLSQVPISLVYNVCITMRDPEIDFTIYPLISLGRYGNWKENLLCLIGCIWRERNGCCFEGKELHLTKLNFLFLKTLHEWTLASTSFSTSNLLDF